MMAAVPAQERGRPDRESMFPVDTINKLASLSRYVDGEEFQMTGTYYVEFGNDAAHVVDRGSTAYGVKADADAAWARASADREWLREQEEFLRLAAAVDRQSLANIDE